MNIILGGLARLRGRRLWVGRRIVKFDYRSIPWRVVFGFALLIVLALLVTLRAHTINIKIPDKFNVTMRLQQNRAGGLNILLERRGQWQVIAVIGRHATLKKVVRLPSQDLRIHFYNDITLEIDVDEMAGVKNALVVNFRWDAPNSEILEDCVYFNSSQWYGGPEQQRQLWPIERLELSNYSYVTKEADKCAIAERYWLSSEGIFYYFNKKVPLFVDHNNIENRAACFIAQVIPPYSSTRARTDLIYAIGILKDVKEAHKYAVERYLNKPKEYPDQRMIKYPIWSTWARHKADINRTMVVMGFADEILKYGFENSQLVIDDLWETCYGSLTVDVERYPDMNSTVHLLKEKGFRVTIWAHPFLNKDCEPWYSEADDEGFLVGSEFGSESTNWWNGKFAGHIDFTKPEASKWYTDRVQKLKDDYGIDGFRFDAGESSFLPQIPELQGDIREHPGTITSAYVKSVAKFGSLTSVRVGHRTQDLPIFIRMLDKESSWSFQGGLPTLVTTLLQMNTNGYPLVLPSVIGGNGVPSKKLFIRWLQANVFMPSMQFSHVPWDFDNETIEISKKFVDLHAEYSSKIIDACKKAVSDGTPVNPPIWWIAPNDSNTHTIWDEYLLGENILVAPVLEPSALERDVYLPAGTWLEGGDNDKRVEGGVWIRKYPAPLDVLPFFVKA